jgi:hypothetical protein
MASCLRLSMLRRRFRFSTLGSEMKPREKKPEIVFRIIMRATGEAVGSYSRACHDEYDFDSADAARHANVHGKFEDKREYAIAKYRVTYELMDDEAG